GDHARARLLRSRAQREDDQPAAAAPAHAGPHRRRAGHPAGDPQRRGGRPDPRQGQRAGLHRGGAARRRGAGDLPRPGLELVAHARAPPWLRGALRGGPRRGGGAAVAGAGRDGGVTLVEAMAVSPADRKPAIDELVGQADALRCLAPFVVGGVEGLALYRDDGPAHAVASRPGGVLTRWDTLPPEALAALRRGG